MYQQKILSKIKEAGDEGASNHELSQIALQYNYEVFKLRKAGYDIRKRRIYHGIRATNTYKYYLATEPKMEPLRVDPTPLTEGEVKHAVQVRLEV